MYELWRTVGIGPLEKIVAKVRGLFVRSSFLFFYYYLLLFEMHILIMVLNFENSVSI